MLIAHSQPGDVIDLTNTSFTGDTFHHPRADSLAYTCIRLPRTHEHTDPVMSDRSHPCLTCGACCASFRVDFAIDELDEMGGRVPAGLAVQVNGSTCRMRGTDHVPVRCAALTGKVGERAACGIYEWRPAPCREFEAGSHACGIARMRHGMQPLEGTIL